MKKIGYIISLLMDALIKVSEGDWAKSFGKSLTTLIDTVLTSLTQFLIQLYLFNARGY